MRVQSRPPALEEPQFSGSSGGHYTNILDFVPRAEGPGSSPRTSSAYQRTTLSNQMMYCGSTHLDSARPMNVVLLHVASVWKQKVAQLHNRMKNMAVNCSDH